MTDLISIPDGDDLADRPQTNAGGILINLPAIRKGRTVNTGSRVNRRLLTPLETGPSDDPRLAFHHSIFCQTSLPYRNPGDDVRLWQREQGAVTLQVQAGYVADPATQKMVEVGLPWGAKPRLILAYLNGEALRQGSSVIEVENSLTAFVKRIRGFDNGREILGFKDQLSRLSAANIRLAFFGDKQAHQVNTQIITAFELWLHKDERQRVLWPSTIQLSHQYFTSLQEHAVPLFEEDLATLAHSAMALDLYVWLAQRLHRIAPHKPVFIQWPAIMQQFGFDYGRMNNFKGPFRNALQQVLARYLVARVELDEHGMRLHHSPPPVAKRQTIFVSLPKP